MCAINVNPSIVDNLGIPGYNCFYQKEMKKIFNITKEKTNEKIRRKINFHHTLLEKLSRFEKILEFPKKQKLKSFCTNF